MVCLLVYFCVCVFMINLDFQSVDFHFSLSLGEKLVIYLNTFLHLPNFQFSPFFHLFLCSVLGNLCHCLQVTDIFLFNIKLSLIRIGVFF